MAYIIVAKGSLAEVADRAATHGIAIGKLYRTSEAYNEITAEACQYGGFPGALTTRLATWLAEGPSKAPFNPGDLLLFTPSNLESEQP